MKRIMKKTLSLWTAVLMLLNIFTPALSFAEPIREKISFDGTATYPPKLIARIKTSDGDPVAISSSDKIYMLATLKYHSPNSTSQQTGYELVQIISNGTGSIEVPLETWVDQNGNNPTPVDLFYADDIQVKLRRTSSDNLSLNSAINDNNQTHDIVDGEQIGAYTISLKGLSAEPVPGTEADPYDKYYYDFELEPISVSSKYNFRTILGNGVYYGITAETLHQENDLQTNFAVNNFELSGGHSITPNLSGDSSGLFYIGSVDSTVKINRGNSNSSTIVYAGEQAIDKIEANTGVVVVPDSTDGIRNNIVGPIISHVQRVSDDMASEPATIAPSLSQDQNNFLVDTSAFPDGVTIYIDGDRLAAAGKLDHGLNIVKKPNQVVVFNFKTTQTININPYRINGTSSATQTSSGDTNTSASALARGVVWNVNKSGATINCGTVLGIVLAPDANVNIAPQGVQGSDGSSGAGWIVSGRTVHNIGGEWHNIYTDMPDVNKAILNLKKKINNERDAFAEEIFNFKLEMLSGFSQGGPFGMGPWQANWTQLQTTTNLGGSIEFTNVDVNNPENTGWTIYRITETGVDSDTINASAYTKDNKTIYAAVFSEFRSAENTNIVYPAVYFKEFDADEFRRETSKHNYEPNRNTIPGARQKYNNEDPEFNNTYSTDIQASIIAHKHLTGRDLETGEITFTLKDKATNGGKVNFEKTNGSDGRVSFDGLKFVLNPRPNQSTEGIALYHNHQQNNFDSNNEYTMILELREDESKFQAGVTRVEGTPNSYDITVTVKYVPAEPRIPAHLEVSISPNVSEFHFYNKYEASGNVQITAEKTLNGRAPEDGSFSFKIYNHEGTYNRTKSNVGSTVTFDEISYTFSRVMDPIFSSLK